MCPPARRYGEDREAALRPAFEVLDVDGDGRIGREDLKSFFSSSAPPQKSSEPVIRSMIAAADANRDGYVAFNEFEDILHGGDGVTIMEEAFKKMDVDQDGELGLEDLKEFMKQAGLSTENEDIVGMISLAGLRGGEGVCFKDFLKVIAVDFA